MPNFSQMDDAALTAWVTNFSTVAMGAPADYGLTSAQLTTLHGANGDLKSKMTARIAAEEAAQAAVAEQKASRQALESLCSYYNTIVKANPAVTDADKIALGIDLRKPPSATPPQMPTELTANGFENGINVLKWNRAGNKPGTQFIVECRHQQATEFHYVGSTTEASYQHEGVKPGEQCTYRVKAQRAGEESPYSNVAVVYPAP